MGPEEVLNLFDSCWFSLQILKKQSQTPSHESNPYHQNQENPQEMKIASLPTIHVRSKSDQLISMTSFSSDSFSPNSVLFTPHLHTIFSGKESKPENSPSPVSLPSQSHDLAADFEISFSSYGWNNIEHEILSTKNPDPISVPSQSTNGASRFAYLEIPTIVCGYESIRAEEQRVLGTEGRDPMKSTSMRRIRSKKGMTKSLSDLEFKELKGFMDLGFVFSEEDVNSSLVEIIPGLQRLSKNLDGEKQKGTNSDKSLVQRPYLSEAWEVLGRRKRAMPLVNWRIPDLGNEIDMKDSLKLWAHTVASAVR